MDKIPIDVTCLCGARLVSWRKLPSDVDKAVREFNDAHKKCREQSVFDQVFGDKQT